MKKLNKTVVIATTVSVASMLLSAACGYGPPVQDNYSNSNNDTSTVQDDTKHNTNNLDFMDYTEDTYPDPEPEDVYGPPVAD